MLSTGLHSLSGIRIFLIGQSKGCICEGSGSGISVKGKLAISCSGPFARMEPVVPVNVILEGRGQLFGAPEGFVAVFDFENLASQ
jgi:hypothetical protein